MKNLNQELFMDDPQKLTTRREPSNINFDNQERERLNGNVDVGPFLRKKDDPIISKYINRYFSIWLTIHVFVKTTLTSNQISLIAFFIAIFGSFFYLSSDYAHVVIGGILVQFSSIIDGSDGEIARLRRVSSERGAWLDSILDRYADSFISCMLMLHVYYYHSSRLFVLVFGILAIVGVFMYSYINETHNGYLKRVMGIPHKFCRVSRDIRLFSIFIASLFDRLLLPIIFFAVVINVVNVVNIYTPFYSGKLRKHADV